MDMVQQIEVVYQRASLLRQRATEHPVQPDLVEAALEELALVLGELQAAEEELQAQNQTLLATRQQVAAERQRYQDLFDFAPNGYLVTNQTGVIQEANVAIATLLNVSQAYLIGKPVSVFVPEADRPAFYAMLEQINQPSPLPQATLQGWEIQLCPRQRPPVDVAITLSMLCDLDGNKVGYCWLVRDITQDKQVKAFLEQHNTVLEQQIQERTAQIQQALDYETSLKRITDKVRDSLDETQILQVLVQELTQVLNVFGCEIATYDLNRGTVTTRHRKIQSDYIAIAKWLPDIDQAISMATFSDGYHQLLTGQYLQFCEITPTPVSPAITILMCPIVDEHNSIGGLHLFKSSSDTFSDSEIRWVQQVANQCAIAIRQANLYHQSQQQVYELEQLNQLKDTFLSTISHELRTPLSNMNMAIRMLDLLVQQPDQFTDKHDRFTRYLEILKTQCQQETNLINELLELNRLDAHTESLNLTTLDLNSWLVQIISPFEDRFHNQQQHLRLNIASQLPTLTTDAGLLQRILTELLNNACKYTSPQEVISIAAEPTDQGLHLSISNSGIELPPQALVHIFERFYRLPTHDPWKHSGTGLGLALVKKQVHQLGGEITVSNLQGWMTFTLYIPWQID